MYGLNNTDVYRGTQIDWAIYLHEKENKSFLIFDPIVLIIFLLLADKLGDIRNCSHYIPDDI